VIPDQRCEARRTVITSAPAVDVPFGCVVAGSSQSAVLAEPAEASWLVPSFDGVHVVDDVRVDDGEEPASHCFVRAGGVLHPVGAEAVISDDWVAALRQHADRMTFE
jgi:hypothetical protein